MERDFRLFFDSYQIEISQKNTIIYCRSAVECAYGILALTTLILLYTIALAKTLPNFYAHSLIRSWETPRERAHLNISSMVTK